MDVCLDGVVIELELGGDLGGDEIVEEMEDEVGGLGVFPVGGAYGERGAAHKGIAGVAELGEGDFREGVDALGVGGGIVLGAAGEGKGEPEEEENGEAGPHFAKKGQKAGQAGVKWGGGGVFFRFAPASAGV